MGGISQEVYRKIQEVDNQNSTLTSKAQGLSHRVVDRIEFPQTRPDGSVEVYVGQTIELIKRPGATLGIFIREGNGLDRLDGVFVSRLADRGEAERSNIIHVGDEVVSVNNVDVSTMPIDDVVVIMSIPSRLLLRTKYPKSRRGMIAPTQEPRFPLFKLKSASGALNREPSKESDLNEEPIESKTAQTSLGALAARKLLEPTEKTPLLPIQPPLQSHMPRTHPLSFRQGLSYPVTEQPRPSSWYPPRDFGPTADFQRNLSLFTPRVLDSRGLPLGPPLEGTQIWPAPALFPLEAFPPGARLPDDVGLFQAEANSVTATAHVPPRKLLPTLMSPRSMIRRTESLRDYMTIERPRTGFGYPTPGRFTPTALEPSSGLAQDSQDSGWKFPPSIQRLVDAFDEMATTSSDSESGYPPGYGLSLRGFDLKPALRAGPLGPFPGYKSNSLPRRRVGRVKWRNDVKGGSISGSLPGEAQTSDSDGAVSAPELSLSPTFGGYPRRRFGPVHRIRTIDDIFTSEEYRAWMREPDFATSPLFERERRSRDYLRMRKYGGRMYNSAECLDPFAQTPFGLPIVTERFNEDYLMDPDRYRNKIRSSSLPPRKILQGVTGDTLPRLSPYTPRRRRGEERRTRSVDASNAMPLTFDRRRISAPPSEDSQMLVLNGLLVLYIIEGRGLRAVEKQGGRDELYCVVEIDGQHRARTSISTLEQRFSWAEVFEIDVLDAKQADIFIYSWHPKYRHKLCHRGSIKLRETLIRQNGAAADGRQVGDGHKFALSLEPRGQLLLRLGFRDFRTIFRRKLSVKRAAYFGVDLLSLVERENTGLEVPVLLRRMIEEVERRGVDCNGIYALCGSAIKKQELRNVLEHQPLTASIASDLVPDINVITGVVKDFLRELPEAVISPGIYQMLFEALDVCLPDDQEGNAKLLLSVIDCLPRISKCTLMVLMDHFKCVAAHCSHNNMSFPRLCAIFGPLIFCSSPSSASVSFKDSTANTGRPRLDSLDPHLAIRSLKSLLELWPSRNSSSESSGSDNSTINMTNNGERSLVEVWMEENRMRESKC